jgi:hypothetical protein
MIIILISTLVLQYACITVRLYYSTLVLLLVRLYYSTLIQPFVTKYFIVLARVGSGVLRPYYWGVIRDGHSPSFSIQCPPFRFRLCGSSMQRAKQHRITITLAWPIRRQTRNVTLQNELVLPPLRPSPNTLRGCDGWHSPSTDLETFHSSYFVDCSS